VPTVLSTRGFRFFFYSNECNEPPHIHVESGDGYAKFWLEPVSVARTTGYNAAEVRDLLLIVREHEQMLKDRWRDHFAS
jgi:hypothetical protein